MRPINLVRGAGIEGIDPKGRLCSRRSSSPPTTEFWHYAIGLWDAAAPTEPTGPHDLAQLDLSTSSGRPLRVTVPVQLASLTFVALELPAPTDLIRG